ncbi:S41 family peptidase [Gorillibacterium massiliense]|uniref:S41 family peptidase n=1 Tax=Gorillibacterium massiliense TaxID=1280390 RepID=UPI0004B97AF2|nr:S41 family peptidase [Gorillibacterium massiliense]
MENAQPIGNVHKLGFWSTKKILIGTLLVILALAVSACLFAYYKIPISFSVGNPLNITQEPKSDAILTVEQVKEDAAQLTAFIEDVHPLFLNKETEEYKANKAHFLEGASKSMSVADFRVLVSRYLSWFQDGHTRVSWKGDPMLAVDWRWDGSKLLISQGGDLPAGAEVTEIGGVAVGKVVQLVNTLLPVENKSTEIVNVSGYAQDKSMLALAGAKVNDSVELAYTNGSETIRQQVPFHTTSKEAAEDQKPDIESRLEDGVFVITMRSCEMSRNLDQVAGDLQKAVASGVKSVVIDVRDNPGGNSSAVSKLLHAMSMKEGEYGSVIRLSKEISKQKGYLRTSGSITFKPSNKAKGNPNLSLYVLVNEGTFSSANMLAVWVRDGHLGKLVGTPPSNSPSSYGDILYFQLEHSKLYGIVSHKKFTRPDTAKDAERELVPDILVPAGEDALEVAMEAIRQGGHSD